MKHFGKILGESIAALNISKTQFATIVGINRGQLHDVFMGKKSIGEDKFEVMLNTFEFTSTQRQELQDAYYIKLLGKEQFQRIQYIIDSLNQISDEEKHPSDALPLLSKEQFDTLTHGTQNIAMLIANIIYFEAKQLTPRVTTNLPYAFDTVDTAIYTALAQSKSQFDFKHIICFDKVGTSIHNWQNMLQSAKYLKLKYNVLYYYGQKEKMTNIDNAFPYYFLSSSYLVLINESCTDSILISDIKSINSYFSLLSDVVSKCTPLAFFPNDALEFKEIAATIGINETWTHLSYFPCCSTRPFTSEVLHELGQDNLEHREELINAVLNHYSTICQDANKHYFAACDGYKDFANDGKSYEIPGKYMKSLPPHLRRKIFEENMEDIESGNLSLTLVKREKLQIPKHVFLLALKSNVFAMFGYCSEDINDRYYGESAVIFSDKVLSDDIRKLQNYLSNSDYCYSKDFLLYLLRDLVAQCGGTNNLDETPSKQ